MLAHQPLQVNCYEYHQVMPWPQPSPYQYPFYQQQIMPATAPHVLTPTAAFIQPMTAFSPSSSGRFDSDYESDSCTGRSPPASVGLPAMTPHAPPQESESDVWSHKFVENFSRFPSGWWHLSIVSEPPDLHNSGLPRNLWRYHRDQAKVTFKCLTCNGTTTATVQAVFWIYKDDATNTGHIRLKLYGQKCSQCKSIVQAPWRPREAGRALDGLFERVAHDYYGFPTRSRQSGKSKSESAESAKC